MNQDIEHNYIFITPYRSETKRIVENCKQRNFIAPEHKGIGKLEDLHHLLEKKRNISSTHALFQMYNEQTIELIKQGGYHLILDEVFDVVQDIDKHKDDIKSLFKANLIVLDQEDEERVRWIDPDYNGWDNREIKQMVESGDVSYYDETLMLWIFPIDVFNAFNDIIILTYMFSAQEQNYYYNINNIDIKYMGVEKKGDDYYFSDNCSLPLYAKKIVDKIHIVDDERLNSIGDKPNALSVSWFKRECEKKGKPLIEVLENNIYNVFRHKFQASTESFMWTTYKDYYKSLKGSGYSNEKCFIQWNARAMNDFRHKIYLAYCVNVYFQPLKKNYYLDHGADVLEDTYALSMMIQWIFRSAIRDNKDIWIYIPSIRMRNLLIEWLKTLKESN